MRAIKDFTVWLRKNHEFIAVLSLLFIVSVGGLLLGKTRYEKVETLRERLSTQSGHYEAKLEQKRQRLAAVLSHLEANPQVRAPGNHQSLIGPYAKMEWKYGTTENGQNLSSQKDSILNIQKANIILDGKRHAVAGEAAIEWQSNTSGDGVHQYSSKHSIIEIKNAADPLSKDKTIVARVTGEAAWYPISLSDTLGDGGTFLWRVIEGESDASGLLRAEGSWGPYSMFTIYPSAYQRIWATRKIRIGAYNVNQEKFESKDSAPNESCAKPSDGLSDEDRKVLCGVIEAMRSNGMPNLKTVVTRYSDIDHRLLRDLKAGELDIAFGNISKADYREKMGIQFLEYAKAKPVLLTHAKGERVNKKVEPKDKICAVQGTVYEHVLRELREERVGEYDLQSCQNNYDAMDKLVKNEIQWVVMSNKAWETIINPDIRNALYPAEKHELLERVRKQMGTIKHEIRGDAFAMTDTTLHDAICLALRKMEKNRDCQTLGSRSSQKEVVSSRVDS
ncbi:hypothetical protein [Nitrospira sp. BLG_1]|uniref:hypothetical protein n=1 Tax=Nitrospira sp. BLG_1 TaxID=3395883 RepID=UPI0039BD4540